MGAIASQITSLTIVYSTAYSDADQRKHQSSASLAFVWEFTGIGEFPAQMASNAENVSIWWRHHAICLYLELFHNWISIINKVAYSLALYISSLAAQEHPDTNDDDQ